MTLLPRRWSTGLLGLVACAGCNAINPLFGTEASGGASGTDGPGTSGTDAELPTTTGRPADTTTSGVTGPSDSTSNAGTSDTGPGESDVTGDVDLGSAECQAPVRYDLTVSSAEYVTCNELREYALRVNSPAGSEVSATVCETCPCEPTGEEVLFEFPVDVPPGLAGCLRLEVVWGNAVLGGCELRAYRLRQGNLTLQVLSNELSQSLESGLEFTIGPLVEPCTSLCDPTAEPGYHDMITEDGIVIPFGGSATVGGFDVVNDGAGVSPLSCEPFGRWYANG